ncbi:extracellular catalytic domain type 1 short-chain-length polyhydroxyalkanoate depolymerase [Pseudoduganella sp. HUAS MS19]
MHYWLYRPDHMPNTVVRQGWPLIVMLHGCHQSATQFAKGTGMNRLAESKGYAVLYPQQPLRAHPHRCWRWYAPPVQHGGGEAAALVGLIELVCAEHLVNRRRIYVCGISAGAGMAAILALNRPDLFAAVGLHSAPIFGAARSALDGLRVMRHGSARTLQVAIDQMVDLHAARAPLAATVRFPSIPAILIHGDADKAVHPVNQEQLTQQWLSINGIFPDAANQCVTRKPAGRGGRKNAHEIHDYLVGGKPVVRVVRINELGHEWSGGDPSERFNAQAGPDASHMIVNFFSKHRR